MVKRLIVLMLVACFALSTGLVYAVGYGDSKGTHEKGNKDGGFEDKIHNKAMLILKNKEELGLSDEQVKQIKDLKYSSKKDLIKKKADIEVAALDIQQAMCADEADLGATNALIDKKYDLKKAKAKAIVAGCFAIKDILTKDQQEKLKSLCEFSGKKGKDKTKDKR